MDFFLAGARPFILTLPTRRVPRSSRTLRRAGTTNACIRGLITRQSIERRFFPSPNGLALPAPSRGGSRNRKLKMLKLGTSRGAGVRGSHPLKTAKGGAPSVAVVQARKGWASPPSRGLRGCSKGGDTGWDYDRRKDLRSVKLRTLKLKTTPWRKRPRLPPFENRKGWGTLGCGSTSAERVGQPATLGCGSTSAERVGQPALFESNPAHPDANTNTRFLHSADYRSRGNLLRSE